MIWYDISMAKKSEEFKIRISNPHEVVWEGTATALSSENSQGKFDVLSQHANFITIIKEKPITLRFADGTTKEYKFPRAVIYNRNNQVFVHTQI